ncbi:PAAR-like protein [Chitinophaga sp. 30R24]|uniref:PAAR-like protein n=1 Tax=Chitinophaga sp. 30R24 TaxID=3248838 RepID=UPI003B8F777A
MADQHFVVHGALCKCNFGNINNRLQVANPHEYMNDHIGSRKQVAGTNEIGNPFLPGGFGYCTLLHSACTPTVVQWQTYLPNITLSSGSKILTEDSTAICAIAGSPCIQILQHGQQPAYSGNITSHDPEEVANPAIYNNEGDTSKDTANDACSDQQKEDMPMPSIHPIAITNNEILAILAPTRWITGKQYTLSIKTSRPYNEALDGPITWIPFGPGLDQWENASFTKEGTYTISAQMGQSKQSLTIQVTAAIILRWCFTTREETFKPRAGWQEQATMLIFSPDAANETVHLHLLLRNVANRFFHVKDIGIASFNREGKLKITISTNSLKPLLTATAFEWSTFHILFVIASNSSSIDFADVKTITIGNNAYLFPRKTSAQRAAETGQLLRINAQQSVVRLLCLDQQQHPAIKVYQYGEQIKVCIYTCNLSGETLQLEIWENKLREKDHLCMSKKLMIDEQESATTLIDTQQLKSGHLLNDSLLRCFYLLIKTSAGKFLFPADISDNNSWNPHQLSYYRHIKLSGKINGLLNKLMPTNAPVVVGEPWRKDIPPAACPACSKAITAAQLANIFTDASYTNLQTVAATYNQYMALTGMNTCWNKAHFFAQAAVETGTAMRIRNGESFNWYWEDLAKYFPPFRTAEGNIKAREWGRAHKQPLLPGVSILHQQYIANYVYGPNTAKGKVLGNILPEDGWNFRGRGLIQLTGREAYTHANKYTLKENANILQTPDLVGTNIKIAVLSSMTFWQYKGLQLAANGNTEVTMKISKKIGAETKAADKSNYEQKKHLFTTNTALVFRVKECRLGKVPAGSINKYVIHTDTFNYRFVQINRDSNQYRYDVYTSGKLAQSFLLLKNDHHLLPFPETGPNWGRYGKREGIQDNYIDPGVAAPLFGFFYSLPANGFNNTLYFNDISASDKSNLGHKGHINGNDIDIRYPGSTNKAGPVYWKEAQSAYASEQEFIIVLENLLRIAGKWGFTKNYAYKINIKNTTGVATALHTDHFHIGIR